MTDETYLNNEITSSDLNAQYDSHARGLLKDKGVLAYILKYGVEEFYNYTLEEAKAAIDGEPEVATIKVRPSAEAIKGSENESNKSSEGKLYFDIVFTVITKEKEKQKLYINLEAQKSFYPGYDLVTRGIVYAARLLSKQLDTEFTPRNYDGAKKVYSIWVCMNTPATDKDGINVADTITEYSISPKVIYPTGGTETKVKGRYDLLSVVFINLKDNTIKSSNKLIGMLSTLLSSKMSVEDKKRILDNDYGLPMTKEMEGDAAEMCNLSYAIAEEAVKDANVQIEQKDAIIKAKDDENQRLVNEIEQLKAQLAALQKKQ